MWEITDGHVMPLTDLREHECGMRCWCRPTEECDDPGVWVHHSMDGREQFEAGKRMPS